MDHNEHERRILDYQGLVRSIAWKIHCSLPAWVELDDLIGYGNLGLAQASRDFDPELGWKFATYAYQRVRGAILDGLKQMSWFRIADYHRGHYQRLSQAILEEEGDSAARLPSSLNDEVDWLGASCGRLAVVQLLGRQAPADLGWLADPGARAPDVIAEETETYRQLRRLVDQLPPPADFVIRSAYYEGLTLKETGERLGKDKVWASRIHAKALDQLARKLHACQAT